MNKTIIGIGGAGLIGVAFLAGSILTNNVVADSTYEKVDDKTIKVTVPTETTVDINVLRQRLINLNTARADRTELYNKFIAENDKEIAETNKLISEAKKLGIE